ncbi:MAG: 2-hydroxyacyl-CoA dehydratase [Rhodospirillales bacterium]|nr:2-hydroxyacyl-CoA dehydratase [Rhodospirillales bacterium]
MKNGTAVPMPSPAEWASRPLQEIFLRARELVEDPTYPTVKAWRAKGGKVIGHFQVYFPEELAHAGGLLPVKIRGAQTEGLESNPHFGSYLCSILKSSLDVALTKDIELDLFVSLPICDGARNLAGIWGRNFSYKCQLLHLPQNPNTTAALPYLRSEYARILKDIEATAGRKVTDADLARSIGLYNQARALMRDLYRIRREEPWKIAPDESLALVGLAGILPVEDFIALMHAVLPLIAARPARKQDKMRVVFEGGFCEVPPFDLLQAVARSCYVVDDDLYIGLRWLLSDVPVTGDPVENLARAYLSDSSYSPVQHDHDKPKEKMLLKRIKESQAVAAILAAAKMCEPGLDEQVAYAKELEAHKIPYFISEFEENQNSFDDIAIQMETFLENIMFN